jgi:adenine phosphoribosyltransferase
VRKQGKLPWRTVAQQYALEYGTDTLELHVDGVGPRDRVLIVDDVLATGGTAQATAALVAGTGATVVGLGFLIELEFLSGRSRLIDHKIASLLRY